ncbi:UNVERIFIED_CONTAM: hypothetical protein PYX00_003887 [Menopon gallinae]|uniref:Neuropathy target esterase sws n=1 Tax=Menopon gallinae TaxID=328185 RepID=A0AAW2I207_9NEOP
MDVLYLLTHVKHELESLLLKKWVMNALSNIYDNQTLFLVGCSIFLVTFFILLRYLKKWKSRGIIPNPVKELVGVGSNPRFRKRDKVLFYGRKMLRKVKSISGQVHQTKKRKLVMRFARRLLQLRKDTSSTQLQVLEPPAEYLEEDITSKYDQGLPPDALYLLQSLRVFGHFEKPVFLTLCKHTEILTLPAGAFLFKIGDPDENVYVVQSGLLHVFITESNGTMISLKFVKAGESVTSLLSFTDVLTGVGSVYKTVSARAMEDSTIVRLPINAFKEIFQDYPEIFIRVVQVIMVRLQRVTFTALHQYLGLTAELVRPHHVSGHHTHAHRGHRGSGSDESPETKQFRSQTLTASRDDFGRNPKYSTFADELKPNIPNKFFTSNITFQPIVNEVDFPPSKRSTLSGRNLSVVDDLETLQKLAVAAFIRELNLQEGDISEGQVEVKEVSAGSYLMRQDSHKDVALIYLLTGALVLSQKMTDDQQEVHMFTAHPGEIIGGLAVLTGEPSFFTIKAKHISKIAVLSKSTFYEIMKQHPKVVLYVAHTVVRRLSPFVRQVDFALDWLFLESGRAVYRQDTESDSTFIVLSGRLRSVITHSNMKKELVGEYGKGDLVGIVEMVTQTPRSTTVMAVRDSELAKLPEGLFNAIKLRFPIVVTRLINLLGHRLLGTKGHLGRSLNPAAGPRPSQVNFSTVAIVPISDDVPLTAFGFELYHSLCAIGLTLRLTSDMIKKTLGSTIMDPNNEYRLTSWLAQQEDQHKIALYQCDSSFTPWTQRCVRQADCILIIGLAEKGPALGKMEKDVERLAMRTQKELVLLHRENAERPNNTVQWLNARSWVSSHHHIQCNKRMFLKRSQYRINELYKKVLMSEPNIHSDFSRLARWLTGTSVGLVLGGGGARGAAHIGMIKAIQEAGIPIDMVGGVSIGSFVGGLWAMEKNMTTVTQKAREWSKKMTQWYRQILDLTYPVTSIFTGKDFNHTIYSTFGDIHIEDLWIPYFNVTTDITASASRVHKHGNVWRYIRASMSLSGYMPPICDPADGHLLLDGGYVNNLPADVMRNEGARHILAIDVGAHDDQDLTNYGDHLSGFWLLYKRWNPFTTPVKVPDLSDIQSRLSYVCCVRQLEEVKNSDYCEYLRPPIDQYKTLQFALFDEIKEVGYQYGKTYFARLLKSGVLPLFKTDISLSSRPFTSHTTYTFTDLAQMVCKVPRKTIGMEESSSSTDEDDDDDDIQVGYLSEPSSNFLNNRLSEDEKGYLSSSL